MLKTKTKVKVLTLIALMLVSTGFRCTCMSSPEKEALKPIVINYWRVWDSPGDFSPIVEAYKTIHPNIDIKIRRLRYEEFEKELLEAYAQNRPPDIISLHQGWLRGYVKKKFISPMPKEVTMAYQKIESKMGGLKTDVIIEVRTKKTPTLGQIKNDYLETVYDDVLIKNKVYGFPLSVDTMVMYYNRDLLDNAGIALPPTDWQSFQEAVKKTTFYDDEGNVVQAGVAMGTAENINRSSDILINLMRQNGASIMGRNGEVLFSKVPGSNPDKTYNPGVEAILFYTDFANPFKEVYCWNNDMPESLSAFAAGQVAFYFGYSYDLPRIKAASKGKVNLGITPMPQIEGGNQSNIANYWIETVSERSSYKNEAWDFILFATEEKFVKEYLDRTGRPTALRNLIDTQLKDDQMKVFASQLLTSKSWYTGLDLNATEDVIKEMIDEVVSGEDAAGILNLATLKIQQASR